jgi:hypothetical protein
LLSPVNQKGEPMSQIRDAASAAQLPLEYLANLDLLTYLSYAAAVWGEGPWVSARRKKRDTPWLYSSAELAYRRMRLSAPLPPEARETAKLALGWAREELAGRTGLTDYEVRLAAICSRERIFREETNLVGSLLPYWNVARVASECSRPFGVEGSRYHFDRLYHLVTQLRATRYGVQRQHVMIDPCANAFFWFTANDAPVGEVLEGRGTVHSYRLIAGRIVTRLTRCRLDMADLE